jgi:transcriptional regulator with XRE-family HTH domain
MGKKPKTRGGPNPVDVHVGSRVRLRRTLLGMSQEKLGDAVDLTFQQIQKYERGANRIGSSRLFQFSKVLQVPVSFFFDDMPEEISGNPPGLSESRSAAYDDDRFTRRETLELVRAYYRISDTPTRKRLFELIKAVGQAQTPK